MKKLWNTSVEGFEQKADIRNLQATSVESEYLFLGNACMQFQETGKWALNKTIKVAHIEDGLHNYKSGVEWTVGSDLMDAKEFMPWSWWSSIHSRA